MPQRPRAGLRTALPLVLAAAVIPFVGAGCGVGGDDAGTAPAPATGAAAAFVAAGPGAVWVVRGPTLHRLDPATGRRTWSRRITATPPGGTGDLVAVSPGGRGAWVAWRSGAAHVPGRFGRPARIAVPPTAVVTLATVRGHTWLAAGRTARRVLDDGATGPPVRFGSAVSVAPAGDAVRAATAAGGALLDPRTGARLPAGTTVPGPRWRADVAAGRLVPLDPATGAPRGPAVAVPGVSRVVEAPDGGAHALAAGDAGEDLVRVDPGGARVAWRVPVPG